MHIIGASGHGKVIADIVLTSQNQILGVWDEDESIVDFLGLKIAGNLADFIKIATDQYLIAIGNNLTRKKIADQLQETRLIALHPQSAISKQAEIGVGTVVMANASVNIGAVIGKHVIINTNASVDHDCKIADFVHISPQVGLAGNVEVGEGTHIGVGVAVIQNIKIGKWVTIGAGAVIINDVPDYAVVVGNPGKIKKYTNAL